MGNEIGEELVITIAALGMVLDREGEGMIAEPDLLDDVIRCAPGFDLKPVAELVDGLMMGAINLVEPMGRGTIGSQRLDVLLLHFGRVVTGNIEAQSAAQRDIEKLHAFANREDWKPPLERVVCRFKFPAVSLRFGLP